MPLSDRARSFGAAGDVRWLGGVRGRHADRREERREAGRERHRFELNDGGPFLEPEVQVFAWSAPMSRVDVVGLGGTYSGVLVRPASEQAEFFRRLEAWVEQRVPAAGTIDVPMRCRCWRVRLR